MALAGALSALPTSSTWTLHHGHGGILGDLTFTLLVGALAPIHGDKAWLTAALALNAGGIAALLASLGLTRQQWRQILAYPAMGKVARLAEAWRGVGHW